MKGTSMPTTKWRACDIPDCPQPGVHQHPELPDLREQANQISGVLAAEIKPELMTLIRSIGNSIAASLGESPERWIGAVKLIQGIVDPLTDTDFPDEQARQMINLVLAELSTRPAGVMALEVIWKEAIDDGAPTSTDT